MCKDCGCDQANASYFKSNSKSKSISESELEAPHKITIDLEKDILDKNNKFAHENANWFQKHNVSAINLMSSPGSGKTTLLEKTITDLSSKRCFSVLVGDQQTDRDAQRLKNKGARVNQILTHSLCHLDAQMISKELETFILPEKQTLFIENVGNLVCPSAFDLGETQKVALLSVTEGEDKPLKYPVLFHKAHLILITKTDLIPYLDWDKDFCIKCIQKINPKAKIIFCSSKTKEGLCDWYDYLGAL